MPVLRPMTAATSLAHAVLLAAVVVVGLVAGPAGPASAADDDVTWTVRTAANDFGSDRTSFSYGVDPGSQVEDALVVANHGDTALDLAVYAADGYTTESGQLDLLVQGETSTGVGAWVHGDVDSVSIQPGATAEVPFTVQVPAEATPGDYAGGIVTSLSQADDAEGITVDRRLGIRIQLRVGGELRPAVAIEDVHLDYDGTLNPFATGDATVTYTIHNTGNTLISGREAVSVAGPFGWLRAKGAAAEAPPQLLPGERWTASVPIEDVAPLVRLSASAGFVPLVTDASGSTTSLGSVEAAAHAWAVPWTLLLLAVLVAAAVVLGVRAASRRRARRRVAQDARVAEAVAQALREREAASS
ncbi:WxL protein peptidoglycan domain-containing protein [Cellulomonas sp. ICMP 17802]|uniref:WxL protein peptidoglycan domain-containing protein n=1 Tax=Cellulomonas sp. ICMP 17802 TaxID=3239199 RepID=UPI00351BB025